MFASLLSRRVDNGVTSRSLGGAFTGLPLAVLTASGTGTAVPRMPHEISADAREDAC
jgi:hypothetical protein